MKNKILIVDDEKLISSFLQKRLKNENFEVEVAYDGLEATKKVAKQKYDCILVDLMLPFVSGFQLIAHIKESKKNADTPLIVLSALGTENTIVEALSVGANDFFKKPVALNVLIAKIKLFVGGQTLLHSA